MSLQECYRLLGVGPEWRLEDVKSAFRRKLLAVHPDRNPADPLAAERTRKLLEAYNRVVDHLRGTSGACSSNVIIARAAGASRLVRNTGRPHPSAGTTAALIALITFVLIAQVALNVAMHQRQWVFRPDPAAFAPSEPQRDLPVLLEPTLSNTQIWYWTSRYELTLGDRWVYRQILRAYRAAAAEAALHGNTNEAAFYRAAMRNLLNLEKGNLFRGANWF
ncbi:MAG: J domain-containing protein [Armatimonadota bacterium]|nr:J domain-containing protein [Armatimonadota bacterium]